MNSRIVIPLLILLPLLLSGCQPPAMTWTHHTTPVSPDLDPGVAYPMAVEWTLLEMVSADACVVQPTAGKAGERPTPSVSDAQIIEAARFEAIEKVAEADGLMSVRAEITRSGDKLCAKVTGRAYRLERLRAIAPSAKTSGSETPGPTGPTRSTGLVPSLTSERGIGAAASSSGAPSHSLDFWWDPGISRVALNMSHGSGTVGVEYGVELQYEALAPGFTLGILAGYPFEITPEMSLRPRARLALGYSISGINLQMNPTVGADFWYESLRTRVDIGAFLGDGLDGFDYVAFSFILGVGYAF